MGIAQILSTDSTYIKKFRLYGIKTTFRFNPAPVGISEADWLKTGFNELVDNMKKEASPNDQLGFTLTSLNLKNKEPGYVAFRPPAEVNGDLLWEIFGGIIQSNSTSITSNDIFKVACTRVNLPVGTGKRRTGFYNNFEEECYYRKGIVRIQNTDNLCLARALVVAKAKCKKNKDYRLIVQDSRQRQTFKAKKLIAKARVVIPDRGAGIEELEKFQAHLKKYNIIVYNYNTKGRDIIFDGENKEAQYKINLLFSNGHYNVITSLTAAFACTFYCEACHTPYEHKTAHKCRNMCSSCRTISPPCGLENEGVTCPDCNRFFKNSSCFVAHQGEICSSVKKCQDCNKVVMLKQRKSVHKCGEIFCKTCNDFMDPNHQCYIKVDNKKPISENFLYVFFDLETRQDDTLPENPDVNVHRVNLCVSQQYCWKCIKGNACETCNERTHIFKSSPINQFMDYIMDERKKFKNVCTIAHNGQGFDFHFLLKYILEQTKFTPNLITRGTKVLLMEIDNVRFVDSLNYFPMPLSELPKAFGLPAEKKKGFFPHLFNTLRNQNYVGLMPAKHYYCPDSMFENTSNKFEKWYREQVRSRYMFDFQKELLEYCLSDVDILAQACIKFRTMFLSQCNVEPFLEAITIASACNIAFRRNFLKPETIGIIPANGYRLNDVQSKIALQWLCWEEEKRNVQISHAGRGREVKICNKKVDGFDGRRVYQFEGCYFHGCPKCFPYRREEPLKEDPSDSLHLRYERTKKTIGTILEAGYEIVEMWECEFKKLKKEQKLNYLDTHPMLKTLPLNPRDAFYGGRTGNTKIYHKCGNEETINYVDVCSLYPYVCKYGKYPLGHPSIYIGDEECRSRGINVEGLLKCKILPPQELYHPVLPIRMHGKLMFVLCRTCGERLQQDNCGHSDEERSLIGVWTLDEIRKSIEKGYTIFEMYELWEYKVASFESGGLFTEFINTFLKIKQEASGYPSWVETIEDKDKYVKDYYDHEGIFLDKEKIAKNEGLRFLSKLILNSFWGKLGERENLSKTLITRDPREFFRRMTSSEIKVNYIQEINEEVLWMNWQFLEEIGQPLRTANVVLAAFTTSQARLKLYEHLEKLEKQVCYYDTDSVIYVHRPGMYKVPTGDYLGDMTDELEKVYGQGSYITEFVSGGPKTYAFTVYSSEDETLKTVCKIKGLTLSLKTSEKLNFDRLKEMVLSDESPVEIISENRIRRTKDREVVTRLETKEFRVTGPKRKYDDTHDTLPYGYKKPKT